MNNRISKRSHQACENCRCVKISSFEIGTELDRRKKTRCPGERPACSTCLRLHQTCQYERNYEILERSLDGDRVLVRPSQPKGLQAAHSETGRSITAARGENGADAGRLTVRGFYSCIDAVHREMLIIAGQIARSEHPGLTRVDIVARTARNQGTHIQWPFHKDDLVLIN